MKGQNGQAIVLVALLSTVLIGFLGLVIDGGEVAAQQQLVQSAADGAAMAAAYAIKQPAATRAVATTLAQTVLTNLGLPVSDLTLTFLNSGGQPTAVPDSTVRVQAVVSDARRTFFLQVLGIPTISVSATGRAITATCAVCVMGAATQALYEGDNTQLTVRGGKVVANSTSSPIRLGDGSFLTAPSVIIAGGTTVVGSGSSMTPAAVVGAAVTDPLAQLTIPAPGGSPTSLTGSGSGSYTLNPGTYSTIAISGTDSLTLNPGLYVITGSLDISGGQVNGPAGVSILLSCGTISVSNGVLSVVAPTSGPYAAVAIFAARSCTGANNLSGGSVTLTGALYTLGMDLQQVGAALQLNSQVIVSTLVLGDDSITTVAYGASGTGPAVPKLGP